MVEKTLKYLCGVLLTMAMVFVIVFNEDAKSKTAFYNYPLNDYVIVLDAGHGGDDGGAIGIRTLVREKDINLSITKKLQRLFESAGAKVILTRENENALCKNGFNKMEDMRTRAEIIELVKPYIVISVHCNSFPQSKSVKGAQSFYYPGSVTGEALAKNIQESLVKNVDHENKRQVKSEDFYMLRHGSSTNVMIECGFLSSPEEEILLTDEKHQDKLAYAIFDGTCNYIFSLPDNI